MIKDEEIMQLIQLHSLHHCEKDAADSTACFFYSGGAAWGLMKHIFYYEMRNTHSGDLKFSKI